MEIKSLQRVLTRAGGVLRAAGAKPQADAVATVTDLLGGATAGSVEQFVDDAHAALARPELKDLPAGVISMQLRESVKNRAAFDSIFAEMSHKSFDKDKVIEIAGLYTGAGPSAWPTKPKALQAIKKKYDQWVFLEAKARLNEKVTPW